MTDTHLCLTCKRAVWATTANGRRHPNGQGKCDWTPPYIPTPMAWSWNISKGTGCVAQPKPTWGWIKRNPLKAITKCETWEAK